MSYPCSLGSCVTQGIGHLSVTADGDEMDTVESPRCLDRLDLLARKLPARDGRTLEAQLRGVTLPAKFVAKVKTLKTGDPRDPETVIGPVINSSQADAVSSVVEQAIARPDGVRDQRRNVLRVAHVAADRRGEPAGLQNLPRRFSTVGLVDVADHHARRVRHALPGEIGHRCADAEGDLVAADAIAHQKDNNATVNEERRTKTPP